MGRVGRELLNRSIDCHHTARSPRSLAEDAWAEVRCSDQPPIHSHPARVRTLPASQRFIHDQLTRARRRKGKEAQAVTKRMSSARET